MVYPELTEGVIKTVKKYIVLHHSATPDGIVYRDFDAIKRGHLARGFRDIGYNWVIERVNGVLVATPGRPEWDVGAHCIPRNVDGIGVCCVGNFDIEMPTDELYRFVAAKCKDIMTRHPIMEIGGHRQYDATACPGKYFDVGRVLQLMKGEISMGEKKTPCTIKIKGKEFPGYLKGSTSYFGEDVSVRDVIEAVKPVIAWDSKNLTVNIE